MDREDQERSDEEQCPVSKRADGEHGWAFDGDDPRIICGWCGEIRDAISGHVIVPGRAD